MATYTPYSPTGSSNPYGSSGTNYTNPYGSGSYNTSYPTSYNSPTAGTSKGGTPISGQYPTTWRPTYQYDQNQFNPNQYSTNTTWNPGPGATVPNPQQPSYNPNDPSIDYINPDGTPHYNPQYGQNNNNNQQQQPNGGNMGVPRDNPPPVNVGRPRDGDYPPPTNPTGQQPSGGANWNMPFNWQNYSGLPQDQKADYNNYLANYLQFNQGQQNAYQWQGDQAAQRYQFDTNIGVQKDQNEFQKWLNTQQLGQQKQNDQVAYNKWLQEYNFNTGMANKEFGQKQYEFGATFGLQQQGQQQQYGLDKRKQDLAEVANNQNYNLGQRQAALQELQALNQNTQFGQGLDFQKQQETNRTTQFNQGLDFQKWQANQQFGLDDRKQKLAEIANDQNYSIAQRQAANQELQTLNQNTQFNQGLDFQKWQAGQQFGLDDRKQKLAEVANNQNYDIAQRQAAFQELQGLRDYEISQGNLAVNQQQVGNQNTQFWGNLNQQNQQFGRTAALQEWQAQQDSDYKRASLQQAAVEESNRTGISIQQLMQSAKYQDAQTQIERDRLAQTGGLESRGLDIRQYETMAQQQYQQQQLAQQFQIEQMRLAAQKEQAALASTGRLQAPRARWLRSG